MTIRDLIPVALLLGVGGFVALQVLDADTPVTPGRAAVVEAVRRDALVATGDRAAVRALLREREAGTYIGAQLGADSVLLRWTNAPDEPIRVWVPATSQVAGWNQYHARYAREAFVRWEREIPVRFTFVADSAAADIVVGWVQTMPVREQLGKSLRHYDQHGSIRRAEVEIMVRSSDGQDIPEGVARLIALHEVGHALGLDHSPNPRDVMSARYDGRGAGLTEADLATVRLLYEVPPGVYR